MEFTEAEIERYSRHILLREIGGKGQARLRAASVLVIGAGGLGCPAILYLAAAGIGRITIVDHDRVELSNLGRQIAHTTASVGQMKADSAARRAVELNPEIRAIAESRPFNLATAGELIAGHDVVLDGSDNFVTRYLVNDACYFAHTPLITAAVLRFEGTLTTFTYAPGSPCYRCLFPEPPPPGVVPTCQEAGVVGALVGALGALQALECLKLLTGAGASLVGTLLRFDGLVTETARLAFARDAACPLCGDAPIITALRAEPNTSCPSNPRQPRGF